MFQKWNRWTLCKIVFAWLFILSQLTAGLAGTAAAAPETRTVTVSEAVEEAADWIANQGPIADDWYAYALSKAGRMVDGGYLDAAAARVPDLNGTTLRTTYAKLAIGVTAAGGDASSFAGVNLLEALYNSNQLAAQGNNALIYTLLALDSGNYPVPESAVWTRDKLIDAILQKQIPNQGWALYDHDTKADIDLTGSVLWALAPYKGQPEVAAAVTAAVSWLASQVKDNGDFTADRSNSNSVSMALLGLSLHGMDGRQGAFLKAGGNLVSSLFAYMNADGGFSYQTGSAPDGFSTYQALLALIAFNALTGGEGGSYEVPVAPGLEPDAARVFIHIETPDGTIAEGFETAGTPLEALQLLTARNDITFATSEDPFFEVYRIGDVSKNTADGYDYWGFNIKRDGVWTDDWDWKNAALQNGDEIAVFYGPFGASDMLDKIELTPAEPNINEPFQVKVTKFSNGTSVTADVYVAVGNTVARTNAEGIAYFPDGYSAGDKQISVTGDLVNGFPTVIRGVVHLLPYVTVEGPEGTLVSGMGDGGNVFEALRSTVTEVVYTDGMYFSVDAINGIEANDANWWGFALNRNGQWIETGAWNKTAVQAGDRILVYYSALDTQLVDSVAVTPAAPVAGQSFQIAVQQRDWQGVSPASGVKVTVGSTAVTTDAAGIAAFPNGLPMGTYPVLITGYRDGAAPLIVKHTTKLTVAPASTGGGSDTPVVPSVTVQVHGGEKGGSIVTSQSVALQDGDTPYTVLVRLLGESRVESAGSDATLYVKGIDGLMEFDHGAKSGWVYSVNCSLPSTSAGAYQLKNGDRLLWWYSLDSGDDLGASCAPQSGGGSSAPAAAPGNKSDIDDAIAGLAIGYNNTAPASPNIRTVAVLNEGRRMAAEEARKLLEELAANQVSVRKQAETGEETSLADSKGEVLLHIPAQALRQATEFAIEELKDGSRPELLSSVYEFGPSGTSFDKPVYISITAPFFDQTDSLAMAWLNEETNEWIPIPAVFDLETGVITGVVDHFTKFAVIDKSKLSDSKPVTDVSASIAAAVRYVLQDGELSDWEAYALAAAGERVPASYLASVEAQLIERDGVFRNVTDFERLVIGVTAASGDPQHIAGYNLMEMIVNNERMTRQGTNGPIFALVALDLAEYDPPADALWNREKLVKWLLDQQNESGGWPLAPGDASNVDVTAMALTALAPHQGTDAVQTAVGKALSWLSEQQLNSGGFALEGQENSESAAQVLLALAALGIGEHDPRFVKEGNTVVGNVISFQQEDGGFAHLRGEPSGAIPTEQALLALAMFRQAALPEAVKEEQPAGYADERDISSWAMQDVYKARSYGLMEGVGNERFSPLAPLTRAQFVTLLLRQLKIESALTAESGFTDVPPDSWYAGAVAAAANRGLLNGIAEGVFAPDRSITRQEMSLLLMRAFKLSAPETDGASFTDLAEAAPEAAAAIQAVHQAGFMQGDPSGAFRPNDSVTREMAAVVMVRVYEKMLD